ncbi:Phosphate regulatory protein [Halorhabdus tiamatea SARL4B]|uniref:Phosphate regulatory protein n=1 Tax=Halorhabdus tiamatea SARL4B TaxID=1033806 RepID=F7PPQ8_9EURY|nr:phosphate uptake regulator PhoU [Halorhabdus tiamatea]ERJ06573.1 Phosphate regulatory protein [Halorhabdus tiamatea SARL4B]CCQ32260.1 phosphate uptake regulator PhoU / ABC transport system regulatory protein [Halorhabdus tiamatea SARL4B]
METRKAQLTGGTTYTVSLPKPWASEHGIESGSLLYLYPNEDGSILIEPEASSEGGAYTATVDIQSYSEDELIQAVYALYLYGSHSITLVDSTGDVSDRKQTVQSFLPHLIGFEIMESSNEKLILENLTNAESISVRKSALRLRLIVLSMQKDALVAFVENDHELAEQVIDRDDEVDKLLALVMRHFQRSLESLDEITQLDISRAELFEYYYTTRQLERVGDHAEKIAELVMSQSEPSPDELCEKIHHLGEESRKIIEESSNIILSDVTISKSFDILQKRNDVVSEITQLDRELYDHESSKIAHQLGLILDSLRRSADYGANIAEAAIQNAARTGTLPDQR